MSDNFTQEDPNLNEAIASAFADLKAHSADEDGYQKAIDQITKLYKLKEAADKIDLEFATAQLKHAIDAEKNNIDAKKHALEVLQWQHQLELDARPFLKRVDPNVALTVAGNLAIGLAVIKHERTAVITSKVWSFLTKK